MKVHADKKLDIRLLDKMLLASDSFRMETRTIKGGWVLDGMCFFTAKHLLSNRIKKSALSENANPLERLAIAISNGFVGSRVAENALSIDNWVYIEKENTANYKETFSSLFIHIDNNFPRQRFFCWIPGDLESILKRILNLYHEFKNSEYKYEDPSTHKFFLSMINLDSTEELSIKLLDKNNLEIHSGNGETILLAALDLYEKVWQDKWKREAPSITEIEQVIDVAKVDGTKYILSNKVSSWVYEYDDYEILKTERFKNLSFYRGRFYTIEGEFEVFSTPYFGFHTAHFTSIERVLRFIEDENMTAAFTR